MQIETNLTNAPGVVIHDNNGNVVVFSQNHENLKKLIPEIEIPNDATLMDLVDGYERYYIVLPDTPAFETMSLLVMLHEQDPQSIVELMQNLDNLLLVEYRD